LADVVVVGVEQAIGIIERVEKRAHHVEQIADPQAPSDEKTVACP
jgi:hypothetical protein